MNNDKKEETSSTEKEKFNYFNKILSLRKTITVEPLVAFYQMGLFVTRPAMDNLELEKACRVDLNYSNNVCESILEGHHMNYTLENSAIQTIIGEMHSWQRPLQSIMPLVLGLFLGSFSDRYKLRKPFLLLPVLGEIFGVIGCLLCVIYMNTWSLNVLGILQRVIPSLSGGQTLMIMSSTAYIADVSSVQMRTIRIGVLQIVISVISPLVSSFCGILFLQIGYYGILNLAVVFFLIAFCYGLFCITEEGSQCDKPCMEIIRNIFDMTYPLDTLKMLIKQTPGFGKNNVLLMVAVICIYKAAFDGESSVLYLYTQNVFQWTPVQFSYFLTVNGLIFLAGNALSLPLFTKVLKLTDPMILLVTVSSKIVSNIVFGFATTPEIFYTGVMASVITRMFRVAKKSFSTKIVSIEDVGKTQSLISIFEAVTPAISVPLFNLIYVHTLMSQPSAFFFFSIILYAICCFLIIWIYWQQRDKEGKDDEEENKSEKIIETVFI